MRAFGKHFFWVTALGFFISCFVPAWGQDIDFNALGEVLVKGKDNVERTEVAKKLGATKDPRAFDPLIKALKDEDKPVRWAAIESLGDLGDKRAVPYLVKFLPKEERAAYRWGLRLTINALGAIGDSQAVPYLLPYLKHEDPYVRRVTTFALGKIGSVEALPQVIELLKDDSMVVRRWVQHALVQLTEEKIQGDVPHDYESWMLWLNSNNHHKKP